MKTDIYIKSELFSSYEGEEDDINHGRFGKRLAECVKIFLESDDIEVADVYPTDYSYELRIDQFRFSVYVSTGNIDNATDEFLISISPKKEFKRVLFRKISTKEVVTKIYDILYRGFEKKSKILIIDSQ